MGLLGGVPNKKERTKRLLSFSIAGFGQPENIDCEQESTQTDLFDFKAILGADA